MSLLLISSKSTKSKLRGAKLAGCPTSLNSEICFSCVYSLARQGWSDHGLFIDLIFWSSHLKMRSEIVIFWFILLHSAPVLEQGHCCVAETKNRVHAAFLIQHGHRKPRRNYGGTACGRRVYYYAFDQAKGVSTRDACWEFASKHDRCREFILSFTYMTRN